MSTPHINAKPGDFASAVLMPGDPKRAERIAATILRDARVVSSIRGIEAFTGELVVPGEPDGPLLSVMASGMGMPSIGIYATDLYRFFGVERIVRVGTTGGISKAVDVGDVIIATGAHTSSAMNELRIPGAHFAAVADLRMAAAALAAAAGDPRVHTGTVITNDHFYFAVPGQLDGLLAHNVLGVEMETAALYAIAAEHGKAALSVLTVSDHVTKESQDMTAAERETNFADALRLAVAAAFA